MIIFVFCLVLLIMQLVYLGKSLSNSNYNNWTKLFATIVISALSLIALFIFAFNNPYSQGWDPLVDAVLIMGAGVIYLVVFIVSIIFYFSKNKKNKIASTKKDTDKKSINRYIAILVGIVIIVFALKIIPPILKTYVAKDEAINYLKEKYGDGDYKIIDLETANVCEGCSMFSHENGYKITIDTKYLNRDVIVTVSEKELKVRSDDLLEKYLEEKYQIRDIDTYLEEYAVKNMNYELKQHFNATIDFDNISFELKDNAKFGKIPTADDLLKYVKLEDPKFDIKEDLKTEEELLEYLKRLTKYFINDLDKSNISYVNESEYFRYYYNYKKLGVNDYTDEYNGYGGYVFAGDYIPSESGGYQNIDKDKIIRINIMGKVTTFNKEDIIK